MSAPPLEYRSSFSTSGFHDGLGRRALGFDRENGVMLERLVVRPELAAYSEALESRVARMAALDDDRIVRVRGVERDQDSGHLTVVSEFVPGSRLCDLIDAAATQVRDENAPPSVDVALGFLLEMLPALGLLHSRTGVTHGAAGPGRTLLTSAGRVVLLDAVFGEALERAQFTRHRLWAEFRIAMPRTGQHSRFDIPVDLAQAALCAASLAVGRPLRDDEYPNGLASLLLEVVEIAQIRGSSSFASALQRFLQRTIPLPGQRPFTSADDAMTDLRCLVRDEMGVDACRSALTQFLAEMNAGAEEPTVVDERETFPARHEAPELDATPDPASAPIEIDLNALLSAESEPLPARAGRPKSRNRRSSAPTNVPPPASPEPAGHLLEPLSSHMTEPCVGPALDAVVVATAAMPIAAVPAIEQAVAVAPSAVEARAVDPVVAAEQPSSRVPEPPSPRDPEPVVETPVIETPPMVAARPVVQPLGIDFRPVQDRVVRGRPFPTPVSIDDWRLDVPGDLPKVSIEEWRVDAAPEPAVISEPAAPPVAAVVAPPAPIAPAPPATAPPPAAPSARKRHRGPRPHRDKLRSNAAPVPTPVLPPLPPPPIRISPAPEALWVPPATHVPLTPLAAPPLRGQPAMTTVRLKAEPPAGYSPSPARRDARPTHEVSSAGVNYAPRLILPEPPSRFPWKLAAAAMLVMVVGVGVGRAYLPDRSATSEPPKKPIPVAVPAPVSTAGGSIVVETQPAGARVLLDGKETGESPLRLDDVAPGRHVVTLVTSSASVKKVVRVDPGKTVAIDVAVFSGWVAVFAPIVLDVAEKGQSLVATEQGRVMLSPGRHTLTLSNRELGYSAVHTVEIEPGEERALNVEPRGAMSLNALPWAEVFVDGKRVGETPIANLQVPLGTREIVFKHPQYGERRMTATVKATVPSALSVDFGKPPQP